MLDALNVVKLPAAAVVAPTVPVKSVALIRPPATIENPLPVNVLLVPGAGAAT